MQINSFADSLFGIQSASPPAHIKATSFYDQKRKIRHLRKQYRGGYSYMPTNNQISSYPTSPPLLSIQSSQTSPTPAYEEPPQLEIQASIKQMNVNVEVNLDSQEEIIHHIQTQNAGSSALSNIESPSKHKFSPRRPRIRNIKLVKLLNPHRNIIPIPEHLEQAIRGLTNNPRNRRIAQGEIVKDEKRENIESMAPCCVRIWKRPTTHSNPGRGKPGNRGRGKAPGGHGTGQLFHRQDMLHSYNRGVLVHNGDLRDIRVSSTRLLSRERGGTGGIGGAHTHAHTHANKSAIYGGKDPYIQAGRKIPTIRERGTRDEHDPTPFKFSLNNLHASTPSVDEQEPSELYRIYNLNSQTDRGGANIAGLNKDDSLNLFQNKEIAQYLKSEEAEEVNKVQKTTRIKITHSNKKKRQLMDMQRGGGVIFGGFMGSSRERDPNTEKLQSQPVEMSSPKYTKNLFSSFDEEKPEKEKEGGIFGILDDSNPHQKVLYSNPKGEKTTKKQLKNISIPPPLMFKANMKKSFKTKSEEQRYEKNNKKLMCLKSAMEKNPDRQKGFALKFLQEYLSWSDIAKLSKKAIEKFILEIKEMRGINQNETMKGFIIKCLGWSHEEMKEYEEDDYEDSEGEIKDSQNIIKDKINSNKEDKNDNFGRYNTWFKKSRINDKYSKFIKHIQTGNFTEAEKVIKVQRTKNDQSSNILEKIVLERAKNHDKNQMEGVLSKYEGSKIIE